MCGVSGICERLIGTVSDMCDRWGIRQDIGTILGHIHQCGAYETTETHVFTPNMVMQYRFTVQSVVAIETFAVLGSKNNCWVIHIENYIIESNFLTIKLHVLLKQLHKHLILVKYIHDIIQWFDMKIQEDQVALRVITQRNVLFCWVLIYNLIN